MISHFFNIAHAVGHCREFMSSTGQNVQKEGEVREGWGGETNSTENRNETSNDDIAGNGRP